VKQRVRRLERKLDGKRVSIAQTDGTFCVFPDREFWTLRFADEVAAALGETPNSPVSRALEHATPEAATKITEMIHADGGDFLTRATADGFGLVEEAPPDLSAPREGDGDPF
jgi:hypothetical protein